MHIFLKIIFSLYILCLTNLTFADNLDGKVISVSDGDTLTLIKNGEKFRIRLHEIDTPELEQPYGKEAKNALSTLVFRKTVSVKIVTIDDYNRYVGKVFLNNLDINAEMVRKGHAWVYRKYARDKGLYRLEAEAKEKQLGLWALPDDQKIPPWQWRYKNRKHDRNNTESRTKDSSNFIDKWISQLLTWFENIKLIYK